jgi:hypothetical protein
LFAEERQRLLKDTAECQALFAGIQRERRRAVVATETMKREGGDDRAGPSSALKDGK